MPTDDQTQNLSAAIKNIKDAEKALLAAGNVCTDSTKSQQINDSYQKLDGILSQMLQAEAAADDPTFETATTAIKQQTTVLEEEQTKIQSIVDDVTTAGKIAGYLAEAASFIAKL